MSDSIIQGVNTHARAIDSWCKPQSKIRFVTSLYGSQNYGTNGPQSDVDTHTILLPNMAELLLEKTKESGTLNIGMNEKATYKDIHSMFDMYRKGNVNFLETLFTKWYDCNPKFTDDWKQLQAGGELIATYNKFGMYRTIKGYFYEQMNNYVKEHSYKGLANAERLFYMLYYYFVEETPYGMALQFGGQEQLKNANLALKFGQSFTNTKEETAYQVQLETSMEKLSEKVEKKIGPGVNQAAADFLNKMEAQLKLKVLALEMQRSTPQTPSYKDGPRGIKTY